MFFSFSFFGFSLFCAWERWREREREREREFTFLNTLQDDHYESYNTWGINVHFLIITRSTQNQKNTKFLFPFFTSPYSTCNNYLIYFGLVILIVFFYWNPNGNSCIKFSLSFGYSTLMNVSLNFSGDHEGLDHMQCSKLVFVRSVCDELQIEASQIVRLYMDHFHNFGSTQLPLVP